MKKAVIKALVFSAALFTASIGTTPTVTAQDAAKAPRLQFTKTEHDFGKIKAAGHVNAAFEFKNAGDAELEITDVRAACGCTATNLGKKTLAPGESSSITTTLNATAVHGAFAKTITVLSNDPQQPQIVLTIRGTAVGEVNWSPGSNVMFGNLTATAVASRTVEVWFDGDSIGTKLLEATPSSGAVKAAIKELEEGKRYQLEFTTVPPLTPGPNYCGIKIRTSNPKHEWIYCNVNFNVVSAISAFPPAVVAQFADDKWTAAPVVIRNNEGKAFQVTQIDLTPQGVVAEVEPLPGNTAHRIVLQLLHGDKEAFSEPGEIVLHTDDKDTPLVRVPLHFEQPAKVVSFTPDGSQAVTAARGDSGVTSSMRWIPGSNVSFGNVPRNEPATQIVELEFGGPDTHVMAATSTTPAFKVTTREITRGKKYALEITTVPPLKTGVSDGNILVRTDNPNFSQVYCYVSVNATGGIVAQPAEILARSRGVDIEPPLILLQQTGDTQFNILKIEVRPEIFTATSEKVSEGAAYRLTLTKRPGFEDFHDEAQIVIQTDDKDTPEVRIPIRFK